MSTAVSPELELVKYDLLLTLALAQIDAIKAKDQHLLNLIIDQKWTVIRGLSGTKELLQAVPALAGTIKKIQDADALAEQLLATRMGDVRTKLCQINRRSSAGHAYGQTARKQHCVLGLDVDDTTPRFFDFHS